MPSRRRAQFLGQAAKQDRVEAAMLARLGLLGDLQSTPLPDQNLLQLRDLLALRHKLLEPRAALQKLLAKLILQASATPAARLAGVQTDLATCDQRSAIIRSIPGCDPVPARAGPLRPRRGRSIAGGRAQPR